MKKAKQLLRRHHYLKNAGTQISCPTHKKRSFSIYLLVYSRQRLICEFFVKFLRLIKSAEILCNLRITKNFNKAFQV